jgi:hypothetical protein
MHHRQRESRSHRGIHRIAARLHDFDSGPRRQLMHTDHNSMLRVHRFNSPASQRGRAYCRSRQQQ